MKKLLYTLLLSGCVSSLSAGPKIYLNPGHGGYNSNDRNIVTINHTSGDQTGFWESQSNLTKALYLRDMLQSAGATVYMSRTDNRSGYRDDKTISSSIGDRPLSTIAKEASSKADFFLSIHSNAGGNSTTAAVNYLLLMLTGTSGSADWSTSYKYSEAKKAADYALARMGDHPMTWWSSSSKRIYSYTTYTVISPSYLTIPGYLSEGEFHDYKPETHRLLNNDYCKLEAYRLLQAFCDYYSSSMTRPTTGVICGDVRDESSTMEGQTLYQKARDKDAYTPLNGAKVKLKDSNGNVIATYICDNEYNGFYAFWDVSPGTYTVQCAAEGHASKSTSVTVTAANITYNNVQLSSGSGDGMEDVVISPLGVLYDTVIDHSAATWLNDKTIRRAIVSENKLYVLTDDNTIHVVDAHTGLATSTLNKSSISVSSDNSSTKLINDIAMTDDHILLGCQLEQTTFGLSNYWQVFAWPSDESAPAVFAQSRTTSTSANFVTANTGYTFAVSGESTNYSIYTLARSTGGTTYRAVSYDGSHTRYSKNDAIMTTSTISEDTRMVASPYGSGQFVLESSTMHPTLYSGTWVESGTTGNALDSVSSLTLPDVALSGGTFVTYHSHILYITPYGNENIGVGIYDATNGLGTATLIKTLYPETSLSLSSAGYMTSSGMVSGEELVVTLYTQHRGIDRWRLSEDELEKTVPVVPTTPVQGAAIFASNLDMSLSGDEYTFTYLLNTDATDVTLQLLYEGSVIQTKSFGAQSKGLQSGKLLLSEIAWPTMHTDDHLTWSIKATAPATNTLTKLSDDSSPFHFYSPYGVAVDNHPESAYFGRIYVTNGKSGTCSGSSRTTANGLYAFDPTLTALNSTAYTGGVSWNNSTTNGNSPFRMSVASDGRVFLCDWADSHSGVWIAPPGGISGTYTELFAGLTRASSGLASNDTVPVHGSISGCWVEGSGADTKLYTMDEDYLVSGKAGNMLRYDIGESTTWTAAPSAVVFNNAANGNPMVNLTLKMVPDLLGGWWIIQYRYAETSLEPSMIHVRNGAIDYNTGGEQLLENSCRGGLAVNYDGSRIATTSQSQINIWDVTYNSDGSYESITQVYEITTKEISGLGQFSNDVAFDPAGNIYYVSNTSERLVAIGLPKADNTFTTPARSSLTIPIPSSMDVVIAEWQASGLTVDFKQTPAVTDVIVSVAGHSETVPLQALDVTLATGTADAPNYKQINLSSIDFTAYANQKLTLQWQSGGIVAGQTTVTIPTLISAASDLSALNNNASYWSDKEIVVLPGGVAHFDLANFSGALTVSQLEIYPGAKATVTDGTLTTTNLILRGGWTTARTTFAVPHLSIASSASVVRTNAYLDWVLDPSQYYPIAVPYTVTVSEITYRDYPGANAAAGVKFYRYDGEKRATGATGVNWVQITPTTLQPAEGYAVTTKRPSYVMFSVVRMPLSVATSNTVNVTAWGVGGSGVWNNLGWNFVANPYTVPFNSVSDEPAFSGIMQMQNGSAVRYATIPTQDFQDYTQLPVAEANLQPMSSFFIQAQTTGTVVFNPTNQVLAAPAHHAPATINHTDAHIQLSGNKRSDQTFILIGDEYTAEPDFNADLPKLMGRAPKIYSVYGGDSLASLALPTQQSITVPIHIYIDTDGNYTFSLTDYSHVQDVAHIELLDGSESVADLMTGNYTTPLTAGIITNRFSIRIIQREPITTDYSQTTVDSPHADSTRKYIRDQQVIIERNGQQYDVLGKTIRRE